MKEDTAQVGMFGWLGGGRRGVEAYLYFLHRISGIALLGFLAFHVFFSSIRLFGEHAWIAAIAMTHAPLVKLFEYAVFAAFAFHALNGVRLILVELGFAVGRPDAPVFPYKGSIQKQRPLMIMMMLLTAVLIALGGLEFFRLPD